VSQLTALRSIEVVTRIGSCERKRKRMSDEIVTSTMI
jgi:hypothetical protein